MHRNLFVMLVLATHTGKIETESGLYQKDCISSTVFPVDKKYNVLLAYTRLHFP